MSCFVMGAEGNRALRSSMFSGRRLGSAYLSSSHPAEHSSTPAC